ncbi:hypothetical protein [Noviherbaspirillum pedocola]|uniref:Uncharacterized protein n=1 Tax=Noviherbaspirillum pedocola TaxID=2801341 RepID=A0A934W5X7_9BURK|nr:hypothetical protein [Noviherbaspirillum pedocola]MBK4733693.1 hypothetical protein [Noviherbaspirillum pedocola]
MNNYRAVINFKNAFDGVNYLDLCESLKFSFRIWDVCCKNEDFDSPGISQEIKQFFMLHDMMAIHYGYWGYLEYEDVRQKLNGYLNDLCKKPKKEIVEFYVKEYMRQIENRAKIDLMEAQGNIHVIDLQ